MPTATLIETIQRTRRTHQVPYPDTIVCEDDMAEDELKRMLLRHAEESKHRKGIPLDVAVSRLEEKYGFKL